MATLASAAAAATSCGSVDARKWAALVATIWIQAFTGTNFDFSAYSSDLKSVLGVSQVQLNYLAVASDLGKAVGWSSGLALLWLPLPVVLFVAAGMGLAGYGVQWLVITGRVSLPYFSVFLLCLLAGCSICWFNTVCFVVCVRSFSVNRPLALSLTVSFNGVSAALYALLAGALDPANPSLYLLLNATVPLLASAAALLPILRQPPPPSAPPHPESARHDSHLFLVLNALAFLTGLYLLLLSSSSSSHHDPSTARCLLAGALALLVLPLFTPGVICARDWGRRTIYSSFSRLDGGGSGFGLIDIDELEQLHKHLLAGDNGSINGAIPTSTKAAAVDDVELVALPNKAAGALCCSCLDRDRLLVLGEEHGVRRLVRRVDFWLYYVAYFCGATVGLVYSNNIGQIAQSLGMSSATTMLVGVYSACSFFGRLLSAAPDFLRAKLYFARTGWLALALAPMPAAFFLLAWGRGGTALVAGTGIVGLSSGFIFAAAVSVTSELFGPGSIGVNHNVLITNIPLGSLLYGLLAALVYDANGGVAASSDGGGLAGDGAVVCMGRRCYAATFLWWGCISVVGLASSVALFLRTRPAYDRFERNRAILLS